MKYRQSSSQIIIYNLQYNTVVPTKTAPLLTTSPPNTAAGLMSLFVFSWLAGNNRENNYTVTYI